jgi:hypothetical protein
VASDQWTVGQIRQPLQHPYPAPQLAFGNGETPPVLKTVPRYLTGRPPVDLDVDGEIRMAC